MNARLPLIATAAVAMLLGGCRSSGDIVVQEGIGITALRTPCPAVGVPDYTGDITLFRSPTERTAADMDLTATITDLRSTCDETGPEIYTVATFDVHARRTDTSGSRSVTLPYFVTVVRGESAVVSKRVSSVTLTFAPGQERAQATGQAAAYVDRAEATLPEEIRDQITRKRKSGDADAAIDPLSLPEVRAAISRASFELLVGFQLDRSQLAYNVTR